MLKNLWVSQKRQQASFPGDRPRGVVGRLFPYSNYKLEMVVVNGRGDGPRSETKEFTTPEGGRSDLELFPVGLDKGSATWSRWLGVDSQGDLGKQMAITRVTHPHGNLFVKRSVQCAHGLPDTGYETDPSMSSEEKPHVHLATSMSCLPEPETYASFPTATGNTPFLCGLCV